MEAKIRKRILWSCALGIIFVIIYGVFSVKGIIEDATMVCEAGLYGKTIPISSNENPKQIIEIAYNSRHLLNYECKWIILKDGCYCKYKNSEEWTRVK